MNAPLPESSVANDEPISRYLLRPKWFDPRKGRVFAQAFNPPKPTEAYPIRQTSVYRIKGCSEDEIWKIGDDYVTKLHPQQLPVLARADILASTILEADLRIIPMPSPHPLHADIEGWPNEDEQMEAKLTYLSSMATLVVRSA